MIRRLLLVAATVLGVVLVPGQAQAIPVCRDRYTCLYQWWADRDHTIFNGYQAIDCQGGVDTVGTLSGFLEFHQARCGS